MAELVPCRACKHLVSEEAKTCPACGQPVYKWWQPVESKNDGLVKLIMGGIAGLIILLFLAIGESDEPTGGEGGLAYTYSTSQRAAEKAEKERCGDDLEALSFSQIFVKRQLIAPSTAEFGYLADSQISTPSCGNWLVRSYVDAENAFGAKLRRPYSARLEKFGTDWRLIDMQLE